MINIFGGNYDEIGSTNKNLILKTQGKIKILWGKKFIDLIDNDGNINSKLLKLINKVNSLDDISKDGFYIYDGSLYVKYGDNILPLLNYDSDALYVSFVTEQETTSELKYTALKNLGLVYPTLSNVNNIPTNGIIYNEYDKSLYIVDNGILSKYYLEIPNPYTKLFVIAKEGDGNGALVINGEGIENSLYFNDLQIYNQQAYAYYKSLKDHKFYVGNQSVVDITGSGIETNEIKSKGFSYDTGYAILQEGSDYILYIDDIHVRKGIKAEAVKNIIPVRIYKEENVIIDSKVVETIPQTVTQQTPLTGYKLNLFFKYNNNYLVGDKLKIYVETPDKTNDEVNKVYPIDLEVMTTHTGSTKLNYITVDYTINSNYPDNVLEYFNNSICYLYSRIVKDNQGNIFYELDENDLQVLDENDNPVPKRIINEDLVIGDLSGYTGSNNKLYGIISKNNKFYSAKFDKDGENNPNIFPIYSLELYDEFDKHYNDSSYNKVIPPLGVVKDLDIDYYVGVCTITYKNLRLKVVILPDTKFNFRRGTILTVVFTHNENNNTNTYDVTTNNPILFNVYYNEHLDENDQTIYDNTGFKTVYYLNTIKLGQDPTVYGKDGESITYIYDGTNWNWLSGGNSGGLNAILNDINNENQQHTPYNIDGENSAYYDYVLTYSDNGYGNKYYRWKKLNTYLQDIGYASANNKPYSGILLYESGKDVVFEVIKPPTEAGKYLTYTPSGLIDHSRYSWDTPPQTEGTLLGTLLTAINRWNGNPPTPEINNPDDICYSLVYVDGYGQTNNSFYWREIYPNTKGIIYNLSSSALGTINPGFGYLKNDINAGLYKWEIPENINYQNLDYLIFDIISNGTIIFNKDDDVSGNLLYFINNKSTSWNNYDYNDNNGITVSSGDKLFLKGNLVINNTNKSIGTFGGTAEFNVSGNIKALTNNSLHYYAKLFEDCLNIRSAKNLYLPNPNDTSNLNIYNSFFYNSSVNYVKVYSNYSNQYTNFITSSNILNKIFVKPSDSNWDYNTNSITNGVTSDWKILTYEEEKLNDLLPKASGSGYILTTDNDGMWKIVQNLTLVNN